MCCADATGAAVDGLLAESPSVLAESPSDHVDVAGSGGLKARRSHQQAEFRKNAYERFSPLVPDLSVDQLPVISLSGHERKHLKFHVVHVMLKFT